MPRLARPMAKHARGDVGAMLREARERRGLSLRQIANSTKIAMMTLEALERNDIARLPGGIFSRSFVRAYARRSRSRSRSRDRAVHEPVSPGLGDGRPSHVIPSRGSRGGRKRAANGVHASCAWSRSAFRSRPLSSISGRRAGAACSRRSAVASRQSAVGSRQSAVASRQSAVGGQQSARQQSAAGGQQSAAGVRLGCSGGPVRRRGACRAPSWRRRCRPTGSSCR